MTDGDQSSGQQASVTVGGLTVTADISLERRPSPTTADPNRVVTLVGLATSTSAAIGQLVPPERRGAAFGVSGSAFSLGNALGPLVGGLLAAAAGPRAVLGLSAAALALGWLIVRALMGQRVEGRGPRGEGREARAEGIGHPP